MSSIHAARSLELTTSTHFEWRNPLSRMLRQLRYAGLWAHEHQQVANELHAYSDRELAELGIQAADIDTIAASAADRALPARAH